ncbi:oligosaccharide flippase family protein [Halomonas caseinilytica]|uniref:oligosaccharide flippase family protein n=1 Tax=Halomonas caseinilytica TaxID=438744 RepID=UPI0009F22D3F|nr:oligosaccharide flippase family protein [Halomonas caseinilytica]
MRGASLIKNVMWSLSSQVGKVLIQALLFITLARGLGPEDFGMFVTFFSIAQVAYPFSGLGTHNTMVMRVSRYPRLLSHYWLTPFAVTVILGAALSVVLSLLVLFFYDVGFGSALFLFFTELVFFRVLEVATHAWQALEILKFNAIAYIVLNVVRLFVASSLWGVGMLDFEVWVVANAIATFFVSLGSICFMLKKTRVVRLKIYAGEVAKGIFFSLSGSSQTINSNVDKIMLSRLATVGDVGIYAAAYRIIQMSFLPVMAVLQAAYPRFFQEGRKGIDAALGVSKKIMPWLLAYTLITALFLYLLAPVVPYVLGEEYLGAVDFVKFLALMPIIQVCHYLVGEALTGSGNQKVKAYIQIVVCVFNITLNFYLIPQYGVFGAIVSTLMAESVLFVLYGVVGMKLKGWKCC